MRKITNWKSLISVRQDENGSGPIGLNNQIRVNLTRAPHASVHPDIPTMSGMLFVSSSVMRMIRDLDDACSQMEESFISPIEARPKYWVWVYQLSTQHRFRAWPTHKFSLWNQIQTDKKICNNPYKISIYHRASRHHTVFTAYYSSSQFHALDIKRIRDRERQRDNGHNVHSLYMVTNAPKGRIGQIGFHSHPSFSPEEMNWAAWE